MASTQKPRLFVNVSNHSSANWSKPQIEAAFAIAKSEQIVDVPFPQVPANADTTEVRGIAHGIIDKITPWFDSPSDATVMVAGETSVCFYLIRNLLSRGFKVVVACSERVSEEQVQPDGSTKKVSVFKFVQFRKLSE